MILAFLIVLTTGLFTAGLALRRHRRRIDHLERYYRQLAAQIREERRVLDPWGHVRGELTLPPGRVQ